MRRPRSPATLYGLVLVTSGVYASFWALSLMEDLNELLGSQKFKVAAFRRIVVILLFAYALSVLYLMSTIGSTPREDSALRELAFVMAFGLIAFLIWLVVRVIAAHAASRRQPPACAGSACRFGSRRRPVRARI